MNGMLTQEQGDTLIGQGNQDARGRSINAGILGAAEGILTAPDLMSALGKGFGGYNRGYNTSMSANKPRITPLADGAFTQVTMPDGTTKIVGNAQVADFLKNKWATQAQNRADLALLSGQVRTQGAGATADIRSGQEAEVALNSTNSLLSTYDKALKVVQAQADPNAPGSFWEVPILGTKIPKSQIQGLAPGLAGFFGGDQAAANKFLQGLKVSETLANTALTKGAISNAEMALFASPIPDLGADRKTVWEPYIRARIPAIKKLQKFYQDQVAAGRAAATGATVTGTPSAAPTATQRPPAASPRLSTGDPDIDQFLN